MLRAFARGYTWKFPLGEVFFALSRPESCHIVMILGQQAAGAISRNPGRLESLRR
jgi:hypothetical protein